MTRKAFLIESSNRWSVFFGDDKKLQYSGSHTECVEWLSRQGFRPVTVFGGTWPEPAQEGDAK